MPKKSYLSEQIYLMSLTTSDLFTDEEWEVYQRICQRSNEINYEDEKIKNDKLHDPSLRLQKIAEKQSAQKELDDLIASHTGKPRQVRLESIVDTRKTNKTIPNGITWETLKPSRKIAEFSSEMSRSMELHNREVTFNKVVVKWKSEDILKQIILDGFDIPIIDKDNKIETKHYIFVTASAGQLRTDRVSCFEINTWNKISPRILCGLTYKEINRRGGINVNKFLAYVSLANSATIPWLDFDIDRSIVIDDFKAPVTAESYYIDKEYNIKKGINTTVINHIDGCGMMLPCVMRKNTMVRLPFIKGLLASFDYIKFCEVNKCEAKIEDVYGVVHDLVKENIQIIFTKSQFKLWNYYDSWDHYKKCFKENQCQACFTNMEEDYFPDKNLCYQFIQTLVDFTDQEIDEFTKETYDKIKGIATNQESMLRCLGADDEAEDAYKRCLFLYPELLREAYSKQTLKDIKKKWTLDAKSGKIKRDGKRLYAIPDWYAACEYYFLGIKEPEGLLKADEVACKIYRNRDVVDCLRSPHLYMEHALRKVVKDQNIYNWFYTNGIYTSVKDSITKILAFDCDGDQIHVLADPLICNIAERNIRNMNILPLFFDLGKAGNHELTRLEFFEGVKRAHEYSGIGQVSNSLTKLWNRSNPDIDSAAMLTYFNNVVIDAAKTGDYNTYENYTAIKKKINKAIGGKNNKMPYFFQFSKNGRRFLNVPKSDRKDYLKPNESTMNRICAKFDDIGNISMNFANVPPLNWQMLIKDDNTEYLQKAVEIFVELDNEGKSIIVSTKQEETDKSEQKLATILDFIKQNIENELVEKFGSLEVCYPSIVKYLFAGENANKVSHKQMFWKLFGEEAEKNIEENLKTYTICDKCGMKIPSWTNSHSCPRNATGFYECCDCGTWCERTNSREIRCADCNAEYRALQNRLSHKRRYIPRRKKA